MKIALAQIDTTVGDVPGNAARILEAAKRAQKAGAELAVFPEQTLGGYPALDLWENAAFVRAQNEALKKLASKTGELGLIVGFTAVSQEKIGKPFHNAAALLHSGKISAVRHKTLLPTYDVFDEARYFEPAKGNTPVRFKNSRIGISICEDIWAEHPQRDRKTYVHDPVSAQAKAGADLLINLSASPFRRGKLEVRRARLSSLARKTKTPILYCNLVGGNDEIIFDGNSVVFDNKGRLVLMGKAFAEDLVMVDTDRLPEELKSERDGGVGEIGSALILGMRDYFKKCGFSRAFVGLSGGIDSAVVCALAARALGASAVTGVSMPSPYSSPGSVSDAEKLAANLGIRLLKFPITDVLKSYQSALGNFVADKNNLSEQNLQARIRGNYLMALANEEKGLVLATGNKSELAMGYCTLYGDMAGGLAPLSDTTKRDVYALAEWLNAEHPVIPRESIEKPPSAELRLNQLDSDDLPPYSVLDPILSAYIEDGKDPAEIGRSGFNAKLAREIAGRVDRAEFKRRQAAIGLKISGKSFGFGRRLPVARGSWR